MSIRDCACGVSPIGDDNAGVTFAKAAGAAEEKQVGVPREVNLAGSGEEKRK